MHSEGETVDELMANIREAIQLAIIAFVQYGYEIKRHEVPRSRGLVDPDNSGWQGYRGHDREAVPSGAVVSGVAGAKAGILVGVV